MWGQGHFGVAIVENFWKRHLSNITYLRPQSWVFRLPHMVVFILSLLMALIFYAYLELSRDPGDHHMCWFLSKGGATLLCQKLTEQHASIYFLFSNIIELKNTDTSQTWFWPLICMIWMKLTRTDAVFSKTTILLFLCRNKSARNWTGIFGQLFQNI
jgi:hypothetical protein